MTTNVPQDVEALAQEIRRVDGNHSLGAAALAEALMPLIAQLRAQRQQGAEPVASPDGEDYLRLSKSGYTLRVGWGDSMRFVAASPKPLHELSSEQQKQWLDDAERLCDGWNRATPPQANALVAAAYRKAAGIIRAKVDPDKTQISEQWNGICNDFADEILATIPADSESALREVCADIAYMAAMNEDGFGDRQAVERFVNSVLEGGK